MNRKGKVVGALIGASLLVLNSGLGAAEKADGKCATDASQCRDAGRDEHEADFAPLKRQFFEFAGLPDRQRGPSPSLRRAGQAAERSLPGRLAWPALGEGLSLPGQGLSSRLLGLIGRFIGG